MNRDISVHRALDALSVRADARAILTADLAALGLDVEALFAGASLAETGRPAAIEVMKVYARAARQLDDPCLGLRLGSTRGLSWLGDVGRALAAAPTLRAALEIARRYVGVLYAGQRIGVDEQGERCRLTMHLPEGVDPLGAAVVLQSTTVLTANVIAELIRVEPPVRVRLACPRPRDAELIDALRRPGRSLEFEADAFALDIPSAFLATPIHAVADAELRELLARLEAERARLRRSQALEDRLRELLLATLAHDTSLADVARGLAMAPRTLQAQLAERGLTFQTELDRVREQVAIRYLVDTDEPAGAIATRLGFSTSSVFSRFFRRATGLSPRAYRARHGEKA